MAGNASVRFARGVLYQTSSNFSFLRSLAPFKVEFSLFVRCFLFLFFFLPRETVNPYISSTAFLSSENAAEDIVFSDAKHVGLGFLFCALCTHV